jgi:hypothetical protein
MVAQQLELAFILLVVYQEKHFFADFPLQTPWMLGKFKEKGWVAPLAAHAGVHAIFTIVIALFVVPSLWWLGLVDFGIHFAMDRIKASPRMLGRYKSLCAHDFEHKSNMSADRWEGKMRSNRYFWWSLGLDQKVHHLTHYYIIWRLVHGA